jgi:adenylate kinase family enzyme
MNKIYYIGGSPCSGKSTVAEILAEKYGFQYFKQDDYLEEYLGRGIEDGHDLFVKVASMSPDEMWLRSPEEQCGEEIAIYEAMFNYLMDDISKLSGDKPIIADGAGFMPQLLKTHGVDSSYYISMIPTREFQMEMYSKRDWVSEYLADCTSPDLAFENWMERDVLFGQRVLEEAERCGYISLVVDGSKSIEETVKIVEEALYL